MVKRSGLGAGSDEDPDLDEPTDAELEEALEIDRLAQVYRERLEQQPGLTAEDYAAECTTVSAKQLLPILRGMGALTRVTQRMEGPFSHGERIGPYVISGVIGRGGMGIVYEAVEEGLGRVVALKAMHAATGERIRQRFAREARAAARLDHPSIVPVFGSGAHRGVPWYAMRRVDGQGLDQVLDDLRSGDPTLRTKALERLGAASTNTSSIASGLSNLSNRERAAVMIAHRLADALAYAHAEGVLHRDIKPGNVMIERDGSTMLTDFGLCKVDGDATLTRETDIVGTLRYMPPESFGGQTDGRGDVYGIGLLLLEILAERPAFDADDRRTLMQNILHRNPVPLSDGSLHILEDLERVVRKAVAKLPEERYATAADLSEDLRAVLEGQPVRARATTSPLYLVGLFVRRNRALSATLVGALLALGLGAVFYIIQLRAANDAISEARDLAEVRAADASVAGAEAMLRIGDSSGTGTALDDVTEEHRGWMWRHLAQRIGKGTPWLQTSKESPLGFAVSFDGTRGALFGPGELQLVERSGEAALGVSIGPTLSQGAVDARFHPSGDLYWVARSSRELVRWSLSESAPDEARIERLIALPPRSTSLRFSPDGTTALVLDGYNKIIALDTTTWKETWNVTVPIPRADSIDALSSTEFIVGSTGGQVIRGGSGDQPMETVAQHFGRIRGLLVEDGQLLASGGETGQLDLEVALTGHARVRVRLHSAILGIAKHPADAGLLVVITEDYAVSLVDIDSGAITRRFGGVRAEPIGLWGATDPWLLTASMDARLTVHSETDHDGRLELPPTLGNMASPTVSADGRWVSAASNDGVVNFYDLVEGRRFALPMGTLSKALEPNVSPDGRWAALGNLLVDLEQGAVHGELTLPPLEGVLRVPTRSAWLPDGTLMVVGEDKIGSDAPVSAVWSATPKALTAWAAAPESTPSPLTAVPTEPSSPVRQLTCHPTRQAVFMLHIDGSLSSFSDPGLAQRWHTPIDAGCRRFALSDSEVFVVGTDGLVHVLNGLSGELLGDRSWKAAQGITRKSSLNSIAAGPEPGFVSTCTVSGRLEVWSTHDGSRVGTISSGESYLRHVARVGDTPWVLGAGGFGRLVLIGHGTPPVTAAKLRRLFRESGGPAGRLNELAEWLQSDSPERARVTAKSTLQALDRSIRYRRGEWKEAQKLRLLELLGEE
ncbi:MAG: serine/threonine protein kinase/WD40 repeat protein [Planctomycetota bacterium]|jgi:serine/threonine protein kinase/WD40 repeat protein